MKPRNIITKKDATNIKNFIKEQDPKSLIEDQPPTYDDYWQILLKFVPVEVIGFYMVIEGLLISTFLEGNQWALGALFVFGIIATIIWLKYKSGVIKWGQIVASVIAFVIWAYTTGGLFATFSWYEEYKVIGPIAVAVFAFAANFIPENFSETQLKKIYVKN